MKKCWQLCVAQDAPSPQGQEVLFPFLTGHIRSDRTAVGPNRRQVTPTDMTWPGLTSVDLQVTSAGPLLTPFGASCHQLAPTQCQVDCNRHHLDVIQFMCACTHRRVECLNIHFQTLHVLDGLEDGFPLSCCRLLQHTRQQLTKETVRCAERGWGDTKGADG